MSGKFKRNLLVIVFALFSVIVLGQEKLVFASTLIRHGDRTPTKKLKVDPYDWKGGIGELTPHGMRQEFELGSQQRERYVNKLNLLANNYQNNLVYARSTDFNRTIMSAESFLYGLYPPGTGPELSNDTPALPNKFQPIPIRTLPKDQDYLLLAKDNYVDKFEKSALKYLKTDKEWIEKNNLLKDKFSEWEKLFNIKINNLTDIISVGDNLNVRIKNNIPLPENITQKQAEEIIYYGHWAQAQRFKPKYISAVLAKNLLNEIKQNMHSAIDGKIAYKYILYSGHDSTIMPVMSAIGSPLNLCPPYASHIDFELYNIEGKYFTEILYNGEKLNFSSDNENGMMPFEEFIKIVDECQNYSFK